MKFVIFTKADKDYEAGVLPTWEAIEKMGPFNEQLHKDGVLLACEGLRPSSKGTRLRLDEGRTTITDGPFTESKELIAGFWIIEAKSREEVVERFAGAPFDKPTTLEIREFFQPEDFAGIVTPEQQARHDKVTLDDLKVAPPM
jgi:hypothetical protein